MDERHERIRKKAHELWVQDGMPEGREHEHWYKAEDIVRTEDFDAAQANPNPAADAFEHRDIYNPDPAARPLGEAPPKPKARPRSGPKATARDPLLPPIASERKSAKSQGETTWSRS